MAALPSPAPARRPALALAPETVRALARLAGFAALALFAALHWARLLRPAALGALLAGVALALALGVALPALARVADRRLRIGAVLGAAVLTPAVALLAAGVPARLLWPGAWDELAAGLGEGLSALPAIAVPYRGADEWVRMTIVTGGVALAWIAALLAFHPRPGRAPGRPLAAAIALGALYAVPIVERGPQRPFLSGAAFCVLLTCFLWLERLRGDQLAVGGACIALAAALGALIAPRLDGAAPWLDYERIAEDLERQKAIAFDWNHSYGPLDWPRDGREVLRISARQPAYWKTANLDLFDGLRWQRSGSVRPNRPDTERPRREWVGTIRVLDRGLRSESFVGAGTTLQIVAGTETAVQVAPGTYDTARRPLRPGSSYSARVYVPRPSEAQLRAAGTDYPGFVTEDYLEMVVPLDGRDPLPDPITGRPITSGSVVVRFPAWAEDAPPTVRYRTRDVDFRGRQALADSPYARVYALAQRLRAQARTPDELVERVRARVMADAAYTETPIASAAPLVDFLFTSRAGYCQHFSGAMALLLRMGGVPARVATGFSPGNLDRRRGEYVVRDDDAHSWVEAYFPRLGWVTFDPTPGVAPARSQVDEADAAAAAGARASLPTLGQAGDRPFAAGDPGAAAIDDGGPALGRYAAAALAVLLLAGAGLVVARRGRPPGAPLAPELAELQRALHRTGRTPAPDMTLARLEALMGSDGARGYVRTLREQRFAGAGSGPTGEQRRALRRDLGAGLGVRGRLRGWWALPPRGPRLGR